MTTENEIDLFAAGDLAIEERDETRRWLLEIAEAQGVDLPEPDDNLSVHESWRAVVDAILSATHDGRSMQRLIRQSSRVDWDCFCDEMEDALPELKSFLETWGQNCGAPYMVFRGQLCKTILEIWKANGRTANKEV